VFLAVGDWELDEAAYGPTNRIVAGGLLAGMRRRALALLALLVAFALPGCGGGEESPQPQPANDQPGTTTQSSDYGY
jgi:hypothetical protein